MDEQGVRFFNRMLTKLGLGLPTSVFVTARLTRSRSPKPLFSVTLSFLQAVDIVFRSTDQSLAVLCLPLATLTFLGFCSLDTLEGRLRGRPKRLRGWPKGLRGRPRIFPWVLLSAAGAARRRYCRPTNDKRSFLAAQQKAATQYLQVAVSTNWGGFLCPYMRALLLGVKIRAPDSGNSTVGVFGAYSKLSPCHWRYLPQQGLSLGSGILK